MMCKPLRRFLRPRNFEHFKKLVLLFAVFGIFACCKFVFSNYAMAEGKFCETYDVVYTWVNGSDSEFQSSVKKYDPDFDPSRFDDKNELKYSLRSLEKHAPWVRKVFIVTNGQIPHWLDLSNERITVVPHNALASDSSILPTFSSSAIETFIHRIPGLTRKFLYLNDDIFLGSNLYPEDLYTDSGGVKIFSAWNVPDCAADCPWIYIGDGACDDHCNTHDCQFDGGDCVEENEQRKPAPERTKRFKEVIMYTNLTDKQQLQDAVAGFNDDFKSKSRMKIPLDVKKDILQKSTKDIYSQSLISTNKLLNDVYGFKSRNVLGHVGFLLDKDIIAEMQDKFAAQIAETASHRFRDPSDVQFAFLYYNFITSEKRNASLGEIFDEFDTDKSGTWSDREIRTFLARLYPLPLDWSAVRYFEDVVNNCSAKEGVVEREAYTTLVYERYEDSNIPTVTKHLVTNCEVLADGLRTNFAQKNRFQFTTNSPKGAHSNFMMLTSNVTEIVESLDRFRRSPRKFNCINDNLDPELAEENLLVKHILEDFYLSFFPKRSKFELPESFRNRFSNLDEYNAWKERKRVVLVLGYVFSAVLVVFLMKTCCCHKAKYVRRYVQSL